MSKNNVLHCLLKRELKENNPIKYHELIINGSIDSYLEYKEKEIKDMMLLIEKQLRKVFLPPKNESKNIIYENTIKYMAIEIVKEKIKL